MTAPTTFTFGKSCVIQLGNGATPEVFSAPCGFTERSVEIKAETASTAVPDCDDGDAPAWNDTGVKSLSASVNGQGVLSQGAHPLWRAWVLSGEPKNVRVLFNGSADVGYYEGAAVLTSFKLDGAFGEKTKATVALESSGQWDWVGAAPTAGT